MPKEPVTIGIIVTFMFHSFFNSLARSRYLSFFSYTFIFIQWSAGFLKNKFLLVQTLVINNALQLNIGVDVLTFERFYL